MTRSPRQAITTSKHLRLPFRRFFETTFSDLAVLSFAEIPPRVEIQNAAVIGSTD